jgi:hypothetical protein
MGRVGTANLRTNLLCLLCLLWFSAVRSRYSLQSIPIRHRPVPDEPHAFDDGSR